MCKHVIIIPVDASFIRRLVPMVHRHCDCDNKKPIENILLMHAIHTNNIFIKIIIGSPDSFHRQKLDWTSVSESNRLTVRYVQIMND